MAGTKIKVSLDGCDASTEVELVVSGDGLQDIRKLRDKVNRKSTVDCEPKMKVTVVKT